MDGISCVACLTMTLWWISWGAVSVYATHEPFARTFTFSSIFCIGEEGGRADALARFDTLLIRTTVVVSRALSLVCGTHSRVWITSGSNGTNAAVRTNFVLAECSKPTSSGGGQAFVYVCASSVRVDIESSRASTIADSSGDGDTFCTLGAVALVLASCKHTLASILGVRRLAAAVWSIAGRTLHKGISIETRRTFTVKAAGKVLAESICSTCRVFTQSTLVHIPTHAAAFPLESSLAHAFALGAELSSGARLSSRTLGRLRLSFTSYIWVSR